MDRDALLSAAPSGWRDLVQELHGALVERWPDYAIFQVKEKFGTLRFYAEPALDVPVFPDTEEGCAAHDRWRADNVDAFHDIILKYENKSAEVCQFCGKPGTLGDRNDWWSTCCSDCAPPGWVSVTSACEHPTITDGACDACGRQGLARLEHSDVVLRRTHPVGACMGEFCTIHNRSNHSMRAFPQRWRSDAGFMERVCTHGVGHPDPDDVRFTVLSYSADHSCDGCCGGLHE